MSTEAQSRAAGSPTGGLARASSIAMAPEPPTITIMGHAVVAARRPDAVDLIQALGEREAPAHVAYVNAHSLNVSCQRPDYRAALDRADALLNDGSGLQLAARLKGAGFPENLNGADLTPLILERAAQLGWSVYLLGGTPGVTERAAQLLCGSIPDLVIAGTRRGHFPEHAEVEVSEAIRDSGARLLLVAMGNPDQELFIDRNLDRTGVDLAIGVGGFLDFASQRLPRAPAVMNRLGVEWLYRLAVEPRRLWRRYLVGNPQFVVRALRDRRER